MGEARNYAVDGVDFEINEGEFVVIVEPTSVKPEKQPALEYLGEIGQQGYKRTRYR